MSISRSSANGHTNGKSNSPAKADLGKPAGGKARKGRKTETARNATPPVFQTDILPLEAILAKYCGTALHRDEEYRIDDDGDIIATSTSDQTGKQQPRIVCQLHTIGYGLRWCNVGRMTRDNSNLCGWFIGSEAAVNGLLAIAQRHSDNINEFSQIGEDAMAYITSGCEPVTIIEATQEPSAETIQALRDERARRAANESAA